MPTTNASTSKSSSLEAEAASEDTSQPNLMDSDELDDDDECLQRFLKIRVKHVTELDGTVVGTLLITPSALMFDPDVREMLKFINLMAVLFIHILY